MGIKTELTKDSIKIYGQPDLEIKKKIIIKDYLKDHRIFMMSTIAALTCGGQWKIYNKDSIRFLKTHGCFENKDRSLINHVLLRACLQIKLLKVIHLPIDDFFYFT